ncbi:MAG: hypothetical protein AAF399_25935 [Bacteroidota bacterium]
MLKRLTACLAVCFLPSLVFCYVIATPTSPTSVSFEQLINQSLSAYALTPDNQFKLAAYAELKGTYRVQDQALILPFGSIGELAFFPKNLLFRSPARGIFHLNKYDTNERLSGAINEELNRLFERVMLLGNHRASREHIAFVDKCLARKNLEPFEKLYVRHILIKYGTYDDLMREVSFHTTSLPERTYEYQGPKDNKTIKKTRSAMAIKLTDEILRGYYLLSGGTVYLEDVDRKIAFATGEASDPNVSAFKIFVQKLFIQTVQYVAKQESRRLEELPPEVGLTFNPLAPGASQALSAEERVIQPTAVASSSEAKQAKLRPLYHPESWIPMMLSILRSNGVNIGEEDVIQYFVNEAYFPSIYAQLKPEEKVKVDAYLSERNLARI